MSMVPEFEHGLAHVNGTTLYYETAGVGEPLVLVHGFSLDCRMRDPQFAVFAQSRRALRYDLRGFGRSALPDREQYGHEQDLHALMEHLRIAQADVLGLSLSGMVAVNYALSYPEATRSLVLVHALYAGFQWSTEWRARTGLLWELGHDLGTSAAKESWLDHPLLDRPGKAPMPPQPPRDWLTSIQAGISRTRTRRGLRSIPRPSGGPASRAARTWPRCFASEHCSSARSWARSCSNYRRTSG